LDHHLAVIDGWLQAQLLPWVSFSLSSFSLLSYFLAAVTLVDQLDPEEFNWERFSLSVQDDGASDDGASENLIHVGRALTEPVNLFDGTVSQTAYSQTVSKFLTDRVRAGTFWVNSWTYVELAMQLLKTLHNK
jgi:hypothetical protein